MTDNHEIHSARSNATRLFAEVRARPTAAMLIREQGGP
jgi:hypothetical protein